MDDKIYSKHKFEFVPDTNTIIVLIISGAHQHWSSFTLIEWKCMNIILNIYFCVPGKKEVLWL